MWSWNKRLNIGRLLAALGLFIALAPIFLVGGQITEVEQHISIAISAMGITLLGVGVLIIPTTPPP